MSLISVVAVQSFCGALAATRQFIPMQETGGERRVKVAGESQGNCRALWNLPKTNLTAWRRPRTPRLPGLSEEGLTCQGSQLQCLRPSFICLSLWHTRAFRDHRPTSTSLQRACCCPKLGRCIPKVTQFTSDKADLEFKTPGPCCSGLLSFFFSGEICFHSLTLI